MCLGCNKPLSFLSAFVRTVKHTVVVLFQVRGAFDGHRAADKIIGCLNFLVAETKVFEDAEFVITELVFIQPEDFLAEFIAKDPAVEDKADIERSRKLLLDFLQYFISKTFVPQDFSVDAGTSLEAPVALDVVDDFIDLGFAVTESFQCWWDRIVDDLEISAACELLELDQGKIRFDAGCVTIHQQSDGSCRGDHGNLGVAVTVFFSFT